MAAITTDARLAFPAPSSAKAGYNMYAVIDTSGTQSAAAEAAAIHQS